MAVGVRESSQHKIVSAETIRTLAFDALDLDLAQIRLDRADHVHRDFVLKIEYIAIRPVVAFRPEMDTGRGLDELGSDPHPIARFAHAAFKNVVDAELASDLFDVDGLAFVDEA